MSFHFLQTRHLALGGLVVSAVSALLLCFFDFDAPTSVFLVSKVGYWSVLACFALWAGSLWQGFSWSDLVGRLKACDWRVLALVLVGGTLLLVHESFEFKIHNDEFLLVATSMDMHFNRRPLCPWQGFDVNGLFVFSQSLLDKRPLFHPFLLSLVHDLTGYRPENAFVLNAALTYGFLGLVALLGRSFAGFAGAVLGVGLFAGLPLFGQNACGAGFELLNLVMLLVLVVLSRRWLEKRDAASLACMVYAALLLLQTRYESALLVSPLLVLIPWVWWQERRVILDWRVVLAPLFLVPYALHYKIFSLRPDAYQLEGKAGASTPFSVDNIANNLGHAFNFYFGSPYVQASSPVFSALGWIALPFTALLLMRLFRARRQLEAGVLTVAAFFCALGLHFLFLMSYFWGQFDDMIIRRLSLPSHVWMLFALFLVIHGFKLRRGLVSLAAGAAALSVVLTGVPSMATRAYMQSYTRIPFTNWREDFLREQKDRGFLVVDNDSFFWLLHKVSSFTFEDALKNREFLAFHLRNHSFTNIYVCQLCEVDPATGKVKIARDEDLGPGFVLEPVLESRAITLRLIRLSRVVSIEVDGIPVSAQAPVAGPEPKLTPEEVERLRLEYSRTYLQRLP